MCVCIAINNTPSIINIFVFLQVFIPIKIEFTMAAIHILLILIVVCTPHFVVMYEFCCSSEVFTLLLF